MNHERSARVKWLVRIAKLAILLLIIWAVWGTLRDAWHQLGGLSSAEGDGAQGLPRWQFRPTWLAISGLIYVLGLLPAALFWHRLLYGLGETPRFADTIRAYYVGHLGKYVPGKALVVILRTGMLSSRGVNVGVAAVSVFLETLTMMTVGAFLAAAILAFWLRDQSGIFYGALALAIVAGIPTLPPVFKRIARAVGVGRSDPAVAAKIDQVGSATLASGWLFMALGWLLLGLSYWATLRAMGIEGTDPVRHLPWYVASVSLAMVAGFLLLVLPGGLLVREAALVAVMLPYLRMLVPEQAEAAAWASAALLRIVWVVSELIVSGILYPTFVRETRRGPNRAVND